MQQKINKGECMELVDMVDLGDFKLTPVTKRGKTSWIAVFRSFHATRVSQIKIQNEGASEECDYATHWKPRSEI